jgi:hypothetical protein
MLCAGVLIPVVSDADDTALLAVALQERYFSHSSGNTSFDKTHAGQVSADAGFWILFEHLDCPALATLVPTVGSAWMTSSSEPLFRSAPVVQTPGRGPPVLV